MIKFEKVSFLEFKKGMQDTYGNDRFTVCELKEIYNDLKMPRRSSEGSAGYDFYLPVDTKCLTTETVKIYSGIRACMDPGVVLLIAPRSGLGCKNGTRLLNTIGVIDSDYYQSSNEGPIIVNLAVTKDLNLKAGDKFVQGFFVPYLLTDDDVALQAKRDGGFGSTGE